MRVTVVETMVDREMIRFDVRDTGVGVPEHLQDRIFESFSQADGSTTRQYGGTGLGLTIARRLAEMMDGRLDVTSTPGEGSTFSFIACFGRVAGASQPRPVAADLRGARVLIVDDNATNREILQEQCSRWGMTCTTAHDGREAVTSLRASSAQGTMYDLVIMDQHMPEMDGLTAARTIHAEGGLAGTRVVLLTSVDSETINQPGITRSLTKPVRAGELQKTLAEVLGGTSPETTSSSPAPLAALPSFSGHVLVAEDNPVNQELARTMLQNLGCEVTVVANGLAAVKAVEAGRFDAVLMDVQMPEMDGLVATATIRSREVRTHARRTPIIALTANAFVQDREACMSAGMDDYLGKPFTLEKLRTALGRWLTSAPSADTATGDAAPEEGRRVAAARAELRGARDARPTRAGSDPGPGAARCAQHAGEGHRGLPDDHAAAPDRDAHRHGRAGQRGGPSGGA
jgi:CheY-like chemotaxis protein